MSLCSTDRAIDHMGSKLFARVAVLMALAVGLGISFALFFATRARDEARFRLAFGREARQTVSFLKQGIDNRLDVLRALEAFYRSSEEITRQEFKTFTAEFLRREPGVQAVEWIPLVPRSDRKKYETNAHREGLPHYQFTEKDETGKLIHAGDREEYYPVYYVEPDQGNEGVLGFDLGSDAARRETLSRCRQSGKLTASPELRLVQETGEQRGLLVCVPVYRKAAVGEGVQVARENLDGFFLVVIRTEDFFKHILLPQPFMRIDLYVYDRSIDGAKNLLFFHSFGGDRPPSDEELSSPDVSSVPHLLEDYHVGDREWSVLAVPAASWLTTRRTWLPWLALSAGFLITALLAIYLRQLQLAADLTRVHLLEQRAAREALEQEAAWRQAAEHTRRESERRYRTLFESASDAFLLLGAEPAESGRIIDANQAAAHMHGYTMAEMLALNIRDLNAPESAEKVPSRMDLLLSGETLREEAWHQKKDGTIFPVEINARLIEMDGRQYVLVMDRDIAERKAQEALLKERDSQQRALLNNIPDLAWLKDRESTFIAVNQPFAAACGLAVHDIPGKTDFDFWPRELSERYCADDREVMASGTMRRVLEPFADQQGRIQWIETIKTPIRDDAGIIIGTAGIARDVTEHKGIQDALQESEELYRLTLSNISDAVFITDEEGAFVFVCPNVDILFGYSVEQIIGFGSISALLGEKFVIPEEFASTGETRNIGWRIVDKSGRDHDVLVSVKRVAIKGGTRLYTCRDITELKKTENDLRASEERYRLLFNHSPLGIVHFDRAGVVVDVNEKIAEIMGAPREEILGLDMLSNLDDPRMLKTIHDALEGGIGRYEGNYRSIAGRKVTAISAVFSQILSSDGTFMGGVGLIEDITDRKRAEDELRESEERFRAIFESEHVVMLIIDPESGAIEDASPAASSFYGYSPDDLKRKKISEIDTAPLEHSLEQMRQVNDRECLVSAYEHRLANGEVRNVEACSGTITIGGKERLFSVVTDITERKKMEEALSSSEERYRTIVNLSPMGIFVNVDSRCALANQSFADIIGASNVSDILGREVFTFFPPEYHDAIRKRIAFTLETGRPARTADQPFVRLDGSLVHVEVTAAPIHYEGSRGILVIANDITERMRTEKALRESEERFRQVADVTGEWIWEVDEKGRFRYCSAAVEQILGYAPEELTDRKYFWELIESPHREESRISPLELLQRQKAFDGYTRSHVCKDGAIVILETSGSPIIDSDGTFRGYRGTNRDITDQVQAGESRELLATVIEHAAEAIVITDTEGNIKYVNPAFENITGYASEEVLGANPRVLKSGKHDEAFYQHLWKTIIDGGVWRDTLINKKKDGSLFEEAATISPIRNSSGKIVNYVAVKRDVTKEAQLQRQLIQSQKMEAIGTLAGGIAHDFNNVIFAITGYTELALEELPDGSPLRWDLERVLNAGRRAGEMVKQILAFSRQGEIQRKPLDLSPIVKEGLKFLRASIPSTIEIRQNIQSPLGMVNADPTQMHQVLMNLCTNASHAMRDSKGVLTVELSAATFDEEFVARHLDLCSGNYVLLEVSDTGHGISPEIAERIFEPYFTTKEVNEGTGLGLAVIHGIVKNHGGAITVYSEPGKGSTFKVYLPVTAVRDEARAFSASEPVPSGNERILLVDDEPILVEMGQAILERMGYKVVTSTSPTEALSLFRSDPQRFDLVVTDLTMPKLTGLELAAEIASLRADIPVILCTGFSHKFTEEDAKQAGIHAVIKKPMSKKDVAETVRNVLDGKVTLEVS